MLSLLIKLARDLDIPLVVTNDIHYCRQDDAEAQDVLVCIGTKKLLNDPNRMHFEGDQWYMKTEEEMRRLFPDCPEAIDNTLKIASMCDLTIHQYKTQELKDTLPVYQIPKEYVSQDAFVLHLVQEGLRKRYGERLKNPDDCKMIVDRAMYELNVIFTMGFSGYFLIVWEFINWSKSLYDERKKEAKHYIPIGPGRGSGAGSLVAYAMTITDIDPFRFDLIFERFLNLERVSMPDFDVDMDFEFREEIIKHTEDWYGLPQVGHIVTFGTEKPKAVIADVGRVLGIPLSEVSMLKNCVSKDAKHFADAFTPPDEKHPDNGNLIPYKDDPRYQDLFRLCFKLENVNRNTGLHASGMVIGKTALPNWAPVFKDAKTGKVAVQYTMDIIEPCGLVKFDYLGLKTLSLIRYAEDIINKHRKEREPEFRADQVSETDAKTFDLFCRGDTVAVFQFESPGMQKILRQAKPCCIEEVVALNALYRPGPMDYIQQYIDGKWKAETIHYPDPCLEGILKETYGVMVYQEQVMQVAQKIAGFSLGGADLLRRAMGKKKPEDLMRMKKQFIEGAVKQGFTAQHAEDIFEIMIPFAGYGFNKSHAAAYSVLAYRTAWLKANRPAEFMAANLTNEIASTDKLPVYIEEARKMGIDLDPPDVNRSSEIFDVVDGKIVFGLMGIKGMGQTSAEMIVAERNKNGPYKSFIDFVDRLAGAEINKRVLECLIKTGAFDKLGQNRATLLANYEAVMKYIERKREGAEFGQASLFGDAGIQEFEDYKFEDVEDMPRMEELNMEKELIGCYVSGHPLDSWRKLIESCATVNSENIERLGKESKALSDAQKTRGQKSWQRKDTGKSYVAIGMIQEIRTFINKKGEQMAFAKLADVKGAIDLTFFAKIWVELKDKLEDGSVYVFKGKVDGRREQPSLIVDSLEDPKTLGERAIRELHIELESAFYSANDIAPLKDVLFSAEGNCTVSFHLDVDNKSYIVQANPQIQVPCNESFIQLVREQPLVKDVWTE